MKRILQSVAVAGLAAVLTVSSLGAGKSPQEIKAAKQGVFYEIFVRSFADSDGDGIGDLNGITAKLDYLQDLGVDGLWLTPIFASPSYHGYDVTDYYNVNPDFGTNEDLVKLLDEAHARNMRVILDFVANHTSSEHPWFLSATTEADSPYRDYYTFVNEKNGDDFSVQDKSPWASQVWRPVNGSEGDYYYGIFDFAMPDLNYENPAVREEMKKAAQFWLQLGVDGFRLDAAIHVYGVHEKDVENAETSNIAWWSEFREACEEVNPTVYLVAEAWQSKTDFSAYAQCFDSRFNFDLEEDIISAVHRGGKKSIYGNETLAGHLVLEQEKNTAVSADYIDAVFGSNHDQARIMDQVGNVDKAKLVANIYLTLPGNPFIYYGEEIGMRGQKPDEHIREPFKWSSDGSDMDTSWEEASSNEKTQSLEELQADESDNIYNHYKDVIALRKNNPALSQGSLEAFDTSSTKVLGYKRISEDQTLIVLHNTIGQELTESSEDFVGATVLYDNGYGTTVDGDTITLPGQSMTILSCPQ